MKPDYMLCDCCGGPTHLEQVVFYTGSEMNGAGSMESTYDTYDVCCDCRSQIFQMLCECVGPRPAAIQHSAPEMIHQRIKAFIRMRATKITKELKKPCV